MKSHTIEFTRDIEGLGRWSRSVAMVFSAALSSTTTESACWMRRRIVGIELYAWTTTSDAFSMLGNTEYVWISFLGNASWRFSRRKEPIPEPVPPEMLCVNMKP